MGQDKARLRLSGREFVDHVVGALAEVTEQVRLVGMRDDGARWSVPVIPDRNPGWGPLGGVETALAACQAEWAVIVACDLPLVTGALLLRLAARRENVDAVVPEQRDGRPQPLCAWYRRDRCFPVAERLLAEGEHRPRTLLDQVRTRWVRPDEWADLPGADRFFLNINTPEDFAQAKAFKLS
jgi:molybdopterin-guanine dinucleotide biosynthesis protein A